MQLKHLFFVLFFAFGELLFSQQNPVLMTINGNPTTLAEFEYSYRKNRQNRMERVSADEYLQMYINFKLKVEEAKSRGFDKTAGFQSEYNQYKTELSASGSDESENRYLLQEYHDGMLLFELINKEVWEKSKTDEEGLKKYYEKNAAKYRWKLPKYKGVVVLCRDEYAKNRTAELFRLHPENLPSAIEQERQTNNRYTVKTEQGAWEKGQNDFVDYAVFNGDVVPATGDDLPYFVVYGLVKSQPSFEDVRNLVADDYQEHLEKELVKKLRKKYAVKVNKSVLKQIDGI